MTNSRTVPKLHNDTISLVSPLGYRTRIPIYSYFSQISAIFILCSSSLKTISSESNALLPYDTVNIIIIQ